MMISAITNIKLHKNLKVGFHMLYLLLVLVFISNALLPKHSNDYNTDAIELSENGEHKAKEEKKEHKEKNETDDFIYQSFYPALCYQLSLQHAGYRCVYWPNRCVEYFSPPPELT